MSLASEAEITRLRAELAEAESDRECLKDGNRLLREEFDKHLASARQDAETIARLRADLAGVHAEVDAQLKKWKDLFTRQTSQDAETIARLREALVMIDNRLKCALVGGEVCKGCVEVAKSYCEDALAPSS